jgi:hypothetical protein
MPVQTLKSMELGLAGKEADNRVFAPWDSVEIRMPQAKVAWEILKASETPHIVVPAHEVGSGPRAA